MAGAGKAQVTEEFDGDDLKKLIREVPDYPKPGILFYDITTLLKDPVGLRRAVDALADHYVGRKVDRVVGIEARGFIFAPMVAYRLNAGFIPVRKPRKLPAERSQHGQLQPGIRERRARDPSRCRQARARKS